MDLNRAATFVRVVEAGNFTRAAEALNLPPSSISRSVSKLEDDLGVVLLERTTRRVALTDAGRAFFERAREALAGLEEANSLALDAAQEAHGVVRVAMPLEMASNAGSLFKLFSAAQPRIRIELTFTNRGAELVGDLVDIAVSVDRLPDSSLVTKRIGHALNKLYASPAYLERAGQVKSLADLAKHDVIAARAIGGETRWELLGPKGTETVDVQARIVGDSVGFIEDAAVSGLGVALLPAWSGEKRVANEELVAVLPKYAQAVTVHVLTHGSRHLPRRVALARDFLAQVMAPKCAEHGRIEPLEKKAQA
ncbi:MAG TPA: LysR substrate-binding domain-containing protein [Kofleriaceae bacterium]|jgi:DNA-binding transcriptional LysR family regulator